MPRPRLRTLTLVALSPSSHRTASTAATLQPHTRHDPRWEGWQPTIGLELHVQLKGNPKLFSHETATYDATPNTHVAPFDAALPGTLPTLHPTPLRLALLASLALKSQINPLSRFDRKHYFYPDLVAGWQVTQRYCSKRGKGKAVDVGGAAKAEEEQDEFFTVRLEQVQLEQDTAKSFHDPSLPLGPGTLVDLNRAGAALIEIVTKPDMRSPEEAASFVKALQSILRSSGVSGANMEKGELRCDVNVSVSPLSSPGSGTRCEVKNLNGVRFISAAIESEIKRQIALLQAGEEVESSTLGFSALTLETFHLRSKESSPDYRYMPDPELSPLAVSAELVRKLEGEVGELPLEREERVRATYGLGRREVGVLVALGEGEEGEGGEGEQGVGVRWFEEIVRGAEGEEGGGRDPKVVMNWLIHTLLGLLSRHSFTLSTSPLSPSDLGALIDAVSSKRMNGTEAKGVVGDWLAAMREGREEKGGFGEVLRRELESRPAPSPSSSSSSDAATDSEGDTAFTALIDSLLASHPTEVSKIRAGQTKVIQRLVGEAMKRSRGRADAKRVAEEIGRRLGV
ncbi:Glutamyl-tRNAGln amidotransferase [Rhodotorula toruloides ATCC 204091]|uniref:Glutamyl-tRNA(Gln) amidotransferase subunit B, mitochondrial n=1 Tax=Rhodotorula toruloides TaxID=5286 RepID=A0A2S9ZWT4_RHOTO|nr:Glutamyl-tRNAGln amidotransferase [Rhodotorula toruloides ATCC 204091]PRQ70204.1 Glutamyl-tRNAGln amidotransferase [Rhodotorula toruloides]